ncbi:enoyl-ACP reductase FabI [Engelhardtia mirabilis]|uniref:Enoyl-[acyl-carrier-protein] reductase [NADH] n=1 Tax=Engelhardtia mirabilis TaxID=2528011 RepID=A0A518BIC4_9BACT|nr:Enoyl-[acyl-carrier-protein] reductase [NADH] FabI [Planctomycetes bacterium Pla133]QDV01048.1 Enoyl-[acyl-carrier-protein] reductase [NADH] FabI [Planctomycetes bacterium Pla86]
MSATDFMGLAGRRILIAGVANKKSVGFQVGKRLVEAGARVCWSVRSEQRRDELAAKLPGDGPVVVCDVEDQGQIEALPGALRDAGVDQLHGLCHSIAFANYSEGPKPFHETGRDDFLQAINVSCFSLVQLSRTLKPLFAHDASVVTISISTTRMASENYGYMAPVKAALDSSVAFLAKSFSADTEVRFNAVKAGLLKTSSSAGIPGYLESYLFAEAAIPRKRGLATVEVADTAVFLLSPRSSGLNGQGLVVDAGMELNYFDQEIVSRATRPDGV